MGNKASLHLPGGTTTTGTISAVGAPSEKGGSGDAKDGAKDKEHIIPITVTPDDPDALGAFQEASVTDGMLYLGVLASERRRRAERTLRIVGLGHRLRHRPHQMSGGERQRVAIARAVVGDPPLLADEPTGNLDSSSGKAIIELLHELNGRGTTVVVITHDNALAARLPRRISIRDGRVVDDSAWEEHPDDTH